MTRSKTKSNTDKASPPPIKRVEKSWLLLVKDSLLENINFTIITLQHPAHGAPSKYCLDDKNNKIYEIRTFDEPCRSWFVGETVKSDGSIQMLTPVNPVFLVLPKLKEQCYNRAIPLEDLLSEKGYDKILDFVPSLEDVADLKGPADMKAYKYNEEKTMSWLEGRVRRLAKVLREKKIHVTSGAVSATFVSSSMKDMDEGTFELSRSVSQKDEAICMFQNVDLYGEKRARNSTDALFKNNKLLQSYERYLKYACGMLSEYLQDEMRQSLEKLFNFEEESIETIGNKRKSEVENNGPKKKIKCENSDDESKNNSLVFPEKENSVVKKEKPLTAKEKARQKAASGTKTISSFFTKK